MTIFFYKLHIGYLYANIIILEIASIIILLTHTWGYIGGLFGRDIKEMETSPGKFRLLPSPVPQS